MKVPGGFVRLRPRINPPTDGRRPGAFRLH
jgi:hypothetical protein